MNFYFVWKNKNPGPPRLVGGLKLELRLGFSVVQFHYIPPTDKMDFFRQPILRLHSFHSFSFLGRFPTRLGQNLPLLAPIVKQ